MTAPQQQQQQLVPMPALGARVLTPADYMVIGGMLGSVGLTEADINTFISTMERIALEEATKAARNTALAMLQGVVDMVRTSHQAAAMTIYNRIVNKGITGLISHQRCAQIAYEVATMNPIRQAQVVQVPPQ
jgi:hypothetical protein